VAFPYCWAVVSAIENLLLVIGQTPWAYLVMAGILVVDGFFPFVPGETAVVTLSTLVAASGGGRLWLVLLVAVAATMVGDAISFVIGRKLGVDRWAWMRRPSAAAMIARASTGLKKRPGLYLVGAKFLPFVRVLVTITAGASGLSVRRYVPRSFIASTICTLYHVGVGAVAGFWFPVNPLLAAVGAIVVVLAIGFVLDAIGRRRRQPDLGS
jgi:membrane-associated protein